MIRTIEIPQIQVEWMKLLEAASRGEEVILTRGAQPVAKLVQATAGEEDLRYGSAKGLVTIQPNFDDPIEGFEEYQ